MSDDDSESSNGSRPSGDGAPHIANAALRIAVTSRSADAARTIWHEVRRRIAKSGEFLALPSEGGDAGAAVFHVTAEDLASDEAARNFSTAMFRSVAQLNFIIRPFAKCDADAQRRLDGMAGEMEKHTGFLQVPMSEQSGDTRSEEDALLFQARGIANHLLTDPPPLSSVALSEFASHEKAVRQNVKATKKSAKREGKSKDEDDVAAVAKGARKEKSRKKRDTKEDAPAEAASGGDKAARKAGKAQKKSERKSAKKASAAPVAAIAEAALTSEGEKTQKKDKPAKKAAKAAKKEARAAKRESRKDEAQPASGAEAASSAKKDKSQSKAERKARKAASAESGPVESEAAEGGRREKRKAKKKAKRQRRAEGGEEGEVSKEERKKAKAEKKEKKAKGEKKEKRQRRAESDEGGEVTKADRKKAKGERKEKRKAKGERGSEEDDPSRPLGIALNGLDEGAAGLRRALERYLDGMPIEWSPEKKPDIAIYGFDNLPASESAIADRAASIAEDNPKLRIFVERGEAQSQDEANSSAGENRAIALLAGSFESPLIALGTRLLRYGTESAPADDVLAASILGIAAASPLSKRKMPRPLPPPPPDLVEARTLAATPREMVSQLSWSDGKAPRLLWTHASKESAEAFMDKKVALSEEETLDLNVPITWPEEASGRSSVGDAFGLEFLSGPLNYWYSKASGRDSRKVMEVDAVLKQRGATASQVLSQTGAIIIDFVNTHPLSASLAWEETPVSRRARVFALYVLCCKMAVKRRIKFDEAVASEIILRLLELIEILRSDDFYIPCSFDGLQQDCLVIGLGLALRGTPYAERLLTEGLQRLKAHQLDPGLTADGVWRLGSFSDHCALLSQFRTLLADFSRDDAALIEPIASAAKKMTVFAEAMQKSNGVAPSFDDSGEKSFLRKLSGTRRALAGAGFGGGSPRKSGVLPRITDTYVFRDAQYFVSHSTQKVIPESSLVMLHADPVSFAQSDPGGITLVFAYGPSDLLVRAEPPEGTKKRDRDSTFDPALRNGYRINGVGYSDDFGLKRNAARLDKSWRGPGWAAARGVNEINPTASVARIVVHLKAAHALIVIDELSPADGTQTAFEQVWHLAPGLSARPSDKAPYRFDLADGGGMSVAFDTQGDITTQPDGEGLCLSRTLRMAGGVAVSLFQWSAEPAPLTISAKGQNGAWSVDCAGAGFGGQLQLAGGELRYTPRAG